MVTPRWEIAVESTLSAQHQLRGVPGEGGRLHEHHWTIRLVVAATQLDRVGWVLDFDVVDATLKRVLAPYDGKLLNDVPPFGDVNPTRENLVRVLAERLSVELDLDGGRARVVRIDVGEGGHVASYVLG